jgi:hypothetical protein
VANDHPDEETRKVVKHTMRKLAEEDFDLFAEVLVEAAAELPPEQWAKLLQALRQAAGK